MAELVQGQASMNQPGLKSEGLADVLQRARQVTTPLGLSTQSFRAEPGRLVRAKALLFGVVLLLLLTYALRQHTLAQTHTD